MIHQRTQFIRLERYHYVVSLCMICIGCVSISFGSSTYIDAEHAGLTVKHIQSAVPDTIPGSDRTGDFITSGSSNPYDLDDPSIIKQEIEYDPITGKYKVTERIGENYFRPPTYLTFEEYMEWRNEKQQEAYFNNLSGVRNDFITFSEFEDPIEQFDLNNDILNRLFGGTEISVQPTGNIDLTLGGSYQKVLNPNIPVRQQRRFNPDFDMDINMGLNAKIGEKLNLNFDYNSNATFSFENKFKLNFDSDAFSEDDIIKGIEAGDVSLPLQSSLIQGNQSLFGLKTELQFGRLYLTTVISQQRSEQENITVQNGAQWQEFEIRANEYDDDRHFLLSHYNRDAFSESLKALPQVQSLFRVTRVEVWVTSINNEYEDLRQIIALADLGEYDQFTDAEARSRFMLSTPNDSLWDKGRERVIPENRANTLYQKLLDRGDEAREVRTVQQLLIGPEFGMKKGQHFELRRARKLSSNRYTLNPQLGTISLDARLRPDEVLAVAYEFTYNGNNFRVGEFSADVPSFSGDTLNPRNQVLFVKMLKSSNQQVNLPMFDLMMKNVYSIGAYQASEEDFQFDVYYDDPGAGLKRYLPEEAPYNTPFLTAYGMDQLNFYGDPAPDGFFDFVPGVTINTRTGKVMFNVLEPFGASLQDLDGLNLPDEIYNTYEYQVLYDSSQFRATEFQEKNRYVLKGSFKSSVSNEISLGSFNLPEGSVVVRSGGVTLREGVDYLVDYQIGKVRIINDAYASSGAPINISFEDRTLFGFNRQSMLGLRADYKLSKKMNIGGTFMKLWERPFTPKVNFGDDPINNNIYGLDFSYSDKAPWLTKAVDAIPGLSTKEESHVDFYVEGAVLKPGHSKAINVGDDEGGVVYIDDFEGSRTGILLAAQVNRWKLASVPEGNVLEWPEGMVNDSLLSGMNRATMNWYRIQSNIQINQNDPYERFYRPDDIFRGTTFANNFVDFRTMDVRYLPKEPGSYNFDPPQGVPGVSAGLLGCDQSESGLIELAQPKTRWAGIMREIEATNFEAANVTALEFWVLNPFIEHVGEDEGEIIFHIGSVSEDIMKDGLAFYENSLPVGNSVIPIDETNWGKVPSIPPVIFAFSNNNDDRELQDVGLDGLNDLEELEHFSDYIDQLTAAYPLGCVNESLNFGDAGDLMLDPARDNYRWFADEFYGSDVGLFERHKKFNKTQGNSPIVTTTNQFSNSFTESPDAEDINEDGTSETTETYFEYRIPISNLANEIARVPNDYITDVVDNSDSRTGEKWYRYKIPLKEFTNKVGGISDFRAIKYVRMITKGFEEELTLRFARMEFTRNNWRIVTQNVDDFTLVDLPPEFDINVVNIEENGSRIPFNYVLPPGIDREENFQSAFRGQQLNEQSLDMQLCNAVHGMVRGVFKPLGFNMREYERLKLFVHAESVDDFIEDGQVSIVIRMGSDYIQNYYEIDVPLDFSEFGESPSDQDVVWKLNNRIDVALQDLKQLKLDRQGPITEPYRIPYGNGTIAVIGAPNLADVESMFIGLRVNEGVDPGSRYCMNAWVNELRLVGLNERGGGAAIGRLDMQLADFGNLSMSGSYSSIGWGSIDQQLLQRQQEEIVGYDAATNLELGKFFGKDFGLSIPFFAQYSNEIRTPRYDPYDRDLTLKEKIQSFEELPQDTISASQIKRQAQTRTEVKTISVNNMRKQPKQGKKVSLPTDISNFSLSATHTTTDRSDPILSQDDSKQQTASLDYQYTIGSVSIEPFKNMFKKSKWLKFVRDFNFSPLPSSIGVRNVLDRRQRERQFRVLSLDEDQIAPATSRQFLWNRDYRLSWNFTKSLRFNYFSTNQSAVDELDNDGFDFVTGDFVGNDRRREHLWNNFKDFGRNKTFDQTYDLSYKVPFSKFPFLDWITTDLQFNANYNWTAASIQNIELGNSISNGNSGSMRVNMNFERLYDKSKFLASLNRSRKTGQRKRQRPGAGGTSKDDDTPTKNKKKSGDPSTISKVLIRPLMSVRRLRFNYSENHSSFVPGINREPSLLGLSSGFEAPGWKYVGGFAPDDAWLDHNANVSGWFVDDDCVNQEFNRSYSEKWDAQLAIEPYNDVQLDISIEREFRESESYLFKNQEGTFRPGAVSVLGSYTISYLSINTLFKDGDANVQALFNQFKSNLNVVSERLHAQNPSAPAENHETYQGFKYGYGLGQQQVIVPAFLAAYTDRDANNVDLDLFDQTPLPNWTLTFNGLTKIPWVKERFSRLTISHGYSSKLTANAFNSELRYFRDDPLSRNNINPITGDYYSRLTIPQIVITEAMNPIVKIDMSTVSDLNFNFEVSKDRTLSLDADNQELNESRSTRWTAGFGYTITDVYLGFLPGQKKRKKKGRKSSSSNSSSNNDPQRGSNFEGNNLTFACDFSLSDDLTVQHLWGVEVTQRPTRGQRALTLSPSIDYTVNEYLTMRAFFDYRSTKPKTNLSYPITNIRGGIRMSFTLR